MQVLIVERNDDLGGVWQRHIESMGHDVRLVNDADTALAELLQVPYAIVVVDVSLNESDAFAIADFASYRMPETKIIFVTGDNFFSDGTIFRHLPNLAAMLPSHAPATDIAALVDFHIKRVSQEGSAG